jgi:ribosome-associated toxin RatA of RatAB toxin-antitoxin module
MADTSSQSVTIAAEPPAIMDVIADFEAYPEWTGAVKQVEVTEPGADGRASKVRFTMDAGLLKDTYELSYTWAADGNSVSWDLVSGQLQKSQHGSYTLKPVAGGTEVTYQLSVELTVPMIGMLRRKAERVILDTALKELRKRVEGS